jgi:hypothetical protein
MVTLYVDGGGDAHALRTACRQGFSKFLEKAGLKGKMPRIVACGSRGNAYDSFRTALENGEPAFLLVDSEAPIAGGEADPWRHLAERIGDAWEKPAGAEDRHCHLMVQCMESWFLADRDTLRRFFGQGFNERALPASDGTIEPIAKADVYQSLKEASRACKTKASYGKGEHSFKLLGLIDPTKVTAASPWAQRFITAVKAP